MDIFAFIFYLLIFSTAGGAVMWILWEILKAVHKRVWKLDIWI